MIRKLNKNSSHTNTKKYLRDFAGAHKLSRSKMYGLGYLDQLDIRHHGIWKQSTRPHGTDTGALCTKSPWDLAPWHSAIGTEHHDMWQPAFCTKAYITTAQVHLCLSVHNILPIGTMKLGSREPVHPFELEPSNLELVISVMDERR